MSLLATSLSVGLCALTLAGVVVMSMRRANPVRQAMQHRGDDADNVQSYRIERASLAEALAQGELTQEDYDARTLQLDRRLLDDTAHQQASGVQPARAGWRLLALLTLIGCGAVGVGYAHWGAEGDLRLFERWRAVADSGHVTPEAYLAQLEGEVAVQPNNPHLWSMLWPLYRDQKRFAEAVSALERQMALTGVTTEGLAEQVQLMYFAAGRQITPDVETLCQRVLSQSPKQPTVRAMLGFDAFLKGKNEEAIHQWELALAGGAEQDGSAPALREGIAAAQARLQANAQPEQHH